MILIAALPHLKHTNGEGVEASELLALSAPLPFLLLKWGRAAQRSWGEWVINFVQPVSKIWDKIALVSNTAFASILSVVTALAVE
jgi:hypothetical protein